MKLHNCRACCSGPLRVIHDFGPQPLAGEFPERPESASTAQRFALDLAQCDECYLLQVTELPPISAVFHDNYRYASSTVPGLVRHFVEYAGWLATRIPSSASVLEFGCNDGVLLEMLRGRGLSCVGIDASKNVADLARKKGLKVHTGFMTKDLISAHGLERRFDLVTCSNVFAHIEGLRPTIEAVALALKPGGLFVVEVHDGDLIFKENQFDTIYHEHQIYFTERTLRRTLARMGFAFVECIRTPMHGGGLRLAARFYGGDLSQKQNLEDNERIDSAQLSAAIARATEDIRNAAKKHGPLDGYGAAGRSQMFINMTRTADCFEQVFDDSPMRQDRYIVGTDVPIRKFAPRSAKACVVLAWNYAPDISRKIRSHYDEVFTVLPKLRGW